MASEPTKEELLAALKMVNEKVTEISEYMPDTLKGEVLGKKPSTNKVKKAFTKTCIRLLEITENCPETLFSAHLDNCGNCLIGNFPQKMEREIGCMQEYYLREARNSIKEAPKDDKADETAKGEEEKLVDMETEFKLSG